MKEFFRTIIVRLLTVEAKLVLAKYHPNIVLITGSVGKTTTKDATYAAFKAVMFVRKSEKSYNSDIGAPLTILGVPNGWSNLLRWMKNLFDGFLLLVITTPYPRWLIMEVGADRPGDISRSLSWVKPNVVIGTMFPELPVHVEYYPSPQAVVEEERYPLSQLVQGGAAVLNADDAYTERTVLPAGVQKISYGFSPSADVRITRYRVTKKQGLPAGISFTTRHESGECAVTATGVIGRTHAYALAAGIAGALASGIPLASLAEVGERYEAPPGRLRLIPGANSSMLIDDSYNSSPLAVTEALESLQNTTHTGRRIAVLGDMLELGVYSKEAHESVGVLAATQSDFLVTVGVRARAIAEAAAARGMSEEHIRVFERGSDAASFLLSEVKRHDVVLIKGSQSMRMERVVKALMEHPEQAPALLPRQDAEWLAR